MNVALGFASGSLGVDEAVDVGPVELVGEQREPAQMISALKRKLSGIAR